MFKCCDGTAKIPLFRWKASRVLNVAYTPDVYSPESHLFYSKSLSHSSYRSPTFQDTERFRKEIIKLNLESLFSYGISKLTYRLRKFRCSRIQTFHTVSHWEKFQCFQIKDQHVLCETKFLDRLFWRCYIWIFHVNECQAVSLPRTMTLACQIQVPTAFIGFAFVRNVFRKDMNLSHLVPSLGLTAGEYVLSCIVGTTRLGE